MDSPNLPKSRLIWGLCLLSGMVFGVLFGMSVDNALTGIITGVVFAGMLVLLVLLSRFDD